MQYIAAKEYILDRLRRELPPELTYHGLHHTLDVVQVVAELCKAEGVDPYETRLLKTAACYHDCGFLVSNVNHEQLGCGIVRATLPRFKYTAKEIDRICAMILATRIPQTPKNLLEEILCDADLDYLGRDDFYSIGTTLYEEFQHYQIVEGEQDWNRLQVNFLKMHNFFTQTSQARRRPRKLEHLHRIEDLVSTYR